MITSKRIDGFALGFLLTIFSAACAVAQSGDLPEPSGEQRQAQPAALDPRIADPGKITEHDPPPLPQRVVFPKPPVFRISNESSQVPMDAELWQSARAAVSKGLGYLRSTQNERGLWLAGAQAAPSDQPDRPAPIAIAVTALAVKAFVQAEPAAGDDEKILRALGSILAAQNADGSFDTGSLSNYITSSVVSALASVEDRDFRDQLRMAVDRLKLDQWDQSEGLNPRQDWYGGAGYGTNGRPDLSNTQMLVDALYDAGLSAEDPAFEKALAFASRAQNLKATNKAAWAGNDGGFVYTPANGGESFASEAAGEGKYGEIIPAGQPRSLRSYGSMTYAGFKSMMYAGLSPDDIRVRAAFDWIRHNWTFDENPGLGQQGVFYYFYVMSRALNISQQHVIEDAKGVKHNWRDELVRALLKRQREDGSWMNSQPRWMEGEPVMATIYALLALEEVLKPATIMNSLP